MSDITPAEKALIAEIRAEFKDRMSESYATDYNLLRWVRGHGEKANVIKCLNKHLKFRKHLKIDSIDEHVKDDEIVKNYMPVGLIGPTGIDNNLLIIEAAGKADPNGLLKSCQVYQFLLRRFKFMEHLYKQISKLERENGKMCGVIYVIDLEGLQMDASLVSTTTGPYRMMWERIGDNYPEWLKSFYVVNTPTFINVLWGALAPFLPEHTREKIKITGENWREELLKVVKPENLPAHWGGKAVDEKGDPKFGSKLIIPPGPIPEQLYWKPGPNDLKLEEMKKVSIPAGSFVLIGHYVLDANVKLRWHIYGEQEYTLGIYFSDDPKNNEVEKMEEIFPSAEYPGLVTQDSLQIDLEASGVYHLKIGNEKAWWYPVEVRYKMVFTDADGNEVKTIPLNPEDAM